MNQVHSDVRLQECIERCLQCYRTCLDMAMNDCLEMGGKHVRPSHLRLMLNCAQICRTAADFMLSNSPAYAPVCAACAEVCDACAESCDQVGEMEACERACQACAQSCREISGGFNYVMGTKHPDVAGSQPAM